MTETDRSQFAGISYRLAFTRDEAAFYIHVALPTWNRLVAEGVMPQPKMIGPRYLWDRREIEMAFANLPTRGGNIEEEEADGW